MIALINFSDILSRFDKIPKMLSVTDRQTYIQADRHLATA